MRVDVKKELESIADKPFIGKYIEKPTRTDVVSQNEFVYVTISKSGERSYSRSASRGAVVYSVRKEETFVFCDEFDSKITFQEIDGCYRLKFKVEISIKVDDYSAAERLLKLVLVSVYGTTLEKSNKLYLLYNGDGFHRFFVDKVREQVRSQLHKKIKGKKTVEAISKASSKILFSDIDVIGENANSGCRLALTCKWVKVHHDEEGEYEKALHVAKTTKSEKSEKSGQVPRETYKKDKDVFNSVCRIYCDGVFVGNGFAVSDYIVTCWHLIFDENGDHKGAITFNFADDNQGHQALDVSNDCGDMGLDIVLVPYNSLSTIALKKNADLNRNDAVDVFAKKGDLHKREAGAKTIAYVCCQGVFEEGEKLIDRCDKCQSREAFFQLLSDGFFGDSGAPVILNDMVVGMISHAKDFREPNAPDASAKEPRVLKAKAILDFIKKYEKAKK